MVKPASRQTKSKSSSSIAHLHKSDKKQNHRYTLGRACYQLKDFAAKIAVFENRIAEYFRVFENRKHRKLLFADQRTKSDNRP